MIRCCSVTEPPSAVRELRVENLSADSVTLTWQTPAYNGNRDDLFYTVKCERCSTSVTFAPGKTNLKTNTVTLTNLLPKSSYAVEVIAENGVSGVAPKPNDRPEVAFITLGSGAETLAEITQV